MADTSTAGEEAEGKRVLLRRTRWQVLVLWMASAMMVPSGGKPAFLL